MVLELTSEYTSSYVSCFICLFLTPSLTFLLPFLPSSLLAPNHTPVVINHVLLPLSLPFPSFLCSLYLLPLPPPWLPSHLPPPTPLLSPPPHLPLQILKMLGSMGLNQYQTVFSSQQVNGDLLSECDDDMLR